MAGGKRDRAGEGMRLESLLKVPGASVRFASMEPLLGPARAWDREPGLGDCGRGVRVGGPDACGK